MNKGNRFRFDLWLYNEMKIRGWDTIDMELETGLNSTTIASYLKGKFMPTLESFAKILNAFGKHIEIVDN